MVTGNGKERRKNMNCLRVYGKRNGEPEKLMFLSIEENSGCIERAKRTAMENHYTITKAIRIGNFITRFAETDVTDKYFSSK